MQDTILHLVIISAEAFLSHDCYSGFVFDDLDTFDENLPGIL